MICSSLLATSVGLALAQTVTAAVSVTGAAEGFAEGVTGGGSAEAVYPSSTDELVSYLGDDSARVIVLEKTFDFTGTEGTTDGTGCAPWGTDSGCQVAINQNDWCTNYEPDAPSVSVSYDNAGVEGITVASDKTIIGSGSSGVIKGKGLRMANGVSNIIIQNIMVTDINPQYVWGGDALTIDGADMIWIDHVTTSLIGRQHLVLGESASGHVTVSNSYFNGETTYSATCDGHHYWGMYFTGSEDYVTFKNNYVHHMSGRSPKVAGNTLLHAVNNYWDSYTSSGHAFEVNSGAYIVAEGNVFSGVPTIVEDSVEGEMFSSPSTSANAACADSLGHVCVLNALNSSGSFDFTDTDFFSNFADLSVANASSIASVQSVPSSAGSGTI